MASRAQLEGALDFPCRLEKRGGAHMDHLNILEELELKCLFRSIAIDASCSIQEFI